LRARGLTPENLDRLTVSMSKKGHLNIGWPYKPGEVIAAQMNGAYAAAVSLLDGEAFVDQYDQSRLADPRILAIIPRIDIIHEPELDRGGASKRHAVKVDAVQTDGTRLSTKIEQRRGSAEHPLSQDEVEQKFRRIAAVALAEASIEELIERIGALENEPSLDRLIELTTTARGR
jgi:2-methylcitrate dehydratase PrpD